MALARLLNAQDAQDALHATSVSAIVWATVDGEVPWPGIVVDGTFFRKRPRAATDVPVVFFGDNTLYVHALRVW
jgi:hypothetical protein